MINSLRAGSTTRSHAIPRRPVQFHAMIPLRLLCRPLGLRSANSERCDEMMNIQCLMLIVHCSPTSCACPSADLPTSNKGLCSASPHMAMPSLIVSLACRFRKWLTGRRCADTTECNLLQSIITTVISCPVRRWLFASCLPILSAKFQLSTDVLHIWKRAGLPFVDPAL